MAVTVLSPTNFASTLQLGGSSVLAHSAYTAKGVIMVGSGVGAATAKAVGADDTVLTASAADGTGVIWATPAGSSKAFGLMMSG